MKKPAPSNTEPRSSRAPTSEAEALRPFAPISSIYPEGSWQEADDHEAQSFAQAMSQVAAVNRKRE
jgi:hypothetical protein